MTIRPFSGPELFRKRVLILTADAGFGHRSAANAVAAATQELYGDSCDISVVNPLEDRRAPFFLRDSQADYDKMVRRLPELYRFGYDASDATVPTALAEQALTILLFEVMRDLIRTYRPDVIVSTYPLYQAPMSAVITVFRLNIPLLVAITDLATVHRMWFNSNVDLCLTPSELVSNLALNYGLKPGQVQLTGIPVSPQIVHETRSQAEIRADLGWQPDIITALAVGSRRVDRLMDTINILNHFGMPIQLIVVAGKDEKLFRELQEVDYHVPNKIYEYVTNLPVMMKAADFLISKAGGLTVTESLAAGLPLLLIDAIPGQEVGNADYVVQNGAGDLARTSMEVLETMAHWTMNDCALLRERAQNACQMGRPRAAYEVATAAWLSGHRAASPVPQGTGALRLMDLLTRNQVHWEEDSSSGKSE